MFARIRNRLTILYAAVMAIFLLAFMMVSYTGVIWLLHREEQQDIKAFAEEEAREYSNLLKQKDYKMKIKDSDLAEDTGGKLFYYVFDARGQLAAAELPISKMRQNIRYIVENWQEADGQGEIKKFYLSDGERAVVIMCSNSIYDGQQLLGRVYVGEDISSYYEKLKLLLIVTVLISVLFLLVAVLVGHLLAGRAIIPIKQSFSRQREFVADASHELRTPLSILLTSVDAIQTDDGNNLSRFSTQVLADMKSEIRRMTNIVADLLTLARADAGVTNILKEKFNFYSIAKQIFRSFQPVAEQKGLKLRLECENNMVIFADRERINQLLMILVDNAIKYTPSGGNVDILIKKVTEAHQSVSITVRDTGVGVPEKYKALIFERFYRIDKVRSREEGGTGLGLSIAKWIVEAHGGTITAESTSGGGSSFVVNLPC